MTSYMIHNVETEGTFNHSGLTVRDEDTNKIIMSLIKTYASPVTPVREVCVNGLEVCNEVHLDITTKAKATTTVLGYASRGNYESGVITVTDSGKNAGMTREFVENYLLAVGASTKDKVMTVEEAGLDTTDSAPATGEYVVGGAGIGAKSPLSISNQVTWRTTKDGVTTVMVLSRVGDGTATNIESFDTDLPNGTSVTIPVDGQTIQRILDRIHNEFLQYADPNTLKVTIDGVENTQVGSAGTHTMEEGDIFAKSAWSFNGTNNVNIISTGNVHYNYTVDNLSNEIVNELHSRGADAQRFTHHDNFTVRFNVPRQYINPHRESLEASDALDSYIINRICDTYESLLQGLEGLMEEVTTVEDWFKTAVKINRFITKNKDKISILNTHGFDFAQKFPVRLSEEDLENISDLIESGQDFKKYFADSKFLLCPTFTKSSNGSDTLLFDPVKNWKASKYLRIALKKGEIAENGDVDDVIYVTENDLKDHLAGNNVNFAAYDYQVENDPYNVLNEKEKIYSILPEAYKNGKTSAANLIQDLFGADSITWQDYKTRLMKEGRSFVGKNKEIFKVDKPVVKKDTTLFLYDPIKGEEVEAFDNAAAALDYLEKSNKPVFMANSKENLTSTLKGVRPSNLMKTYNYLYGNNAYSKLKRMISDKNLDIKVLNFNPGSNKFSLHEHSNLKYAQYKEWGKICSPLQGEDYNGPCKAIPTVDESIQYFDVIKHLEDNGMTIENKNVYEIIKNNNAKALEYLGNIGKEHTHVDISSPELIASTVDRLNRLLDVDTLGDYNDVSLAITIAFNKNGGRYGGEPVDVKKFVKTLIAAKEALSAL